MFSPPIFETYFAKIVLKIPQLQEFILKTINLPGAPWTPILLLMLIDHRVDALSLYYSQDCVAGATLLSLAYMPYLVITIDTLFRLGEGLCRSTSYIYM